MTASPTRTALAWEYSPAPEATDHIRLRDRYGLFIDGDWREADAYEPTINPATEEPLTEIAQASQADVDAAVEAARAAATARATSSAPAWAISASGSSVAGLIVGA